LLTGVPGLMERFPDPASLIRTVPLAEVDAALESAQGRMKRKVLAASEALRPSQTISRDGLGVRRAVIASASIPEPLVAALGGGGTQFIEHAAQEVNA